MVAKNLIVIHEDGTCEIYLTQDKTAIFDVGDIDAILPHRWFAHKATVGGYYAVANHGKAHGGGTIRMHRLVISSGGEVDHINGDGLDNRRNNLRGASSSQNKWNRGKTLANTSGFKGVSRCRQTGLWRANIRDRAGHRSLGRFVSPHQAAVAYDFAAALLHGEFARLNFPLTATAS